MWEQCCGNANKFTWLTSIATAPFPHSKYKLIQLVQVYSSVHLWPEQWVQATCVIVTSLFGNNHRNLMTLRCIVMTTYPGWCVLLRGMVIRAVITPHIGWNAMSYRYIYLNYKQNHHLPLAWVQVTLNRKWCVHGGRWSHKYNGPCHKITV